MASSGVSASSGEDIIDIAIRGEGYNPGALSTAQRRQILRTIRDRGTFRRTAGGSLLSLSPDQLQDIKDEIVALGQTIGDMAQT